MSKKKIAVLACGWSASFITEFINGMKKATKSQSIDIYLFTAYDYHEFSGYPNTTGFSIFSLINYEDFDGVIILSENIKNPRILEKERIKILKAGIPAISINKEISGLSLLKIDNYSGFNLLISHLIRMHNVTDIAYITGNNSTPGFNDCYKAYRIALNENNIEFKSDKVFELAKPDYNSAYSFISEYIKSNKPLPQAFVCSNDFIALAVLKAADENKIKVPENLKVIGCNDNVFSKSVIPSISTVKNNFEQLGAEALHLLINSNGEVRNQVVSTSPVFRKSCGCTPSIDSEQKFLPLAFYEKSNESQNFSKQIEGIEDIFTEASDVFTLLTNLETFFVKSHSFEGHNFCIFLKSDWSSVLINSEESLPQNLSYGNQVQSIVSIQDDKKYLRELISIKNLIPSKMNSDENNVFLFLPIFYHSYVHGYFVCKNSLSLLENNYGYTWTRTFGSSIERFRLKNMYKQIGQQFLKLSTHDALSGMLNRIGLDKIAKPFYAENKKNELSTILFFVDINSMKTINDKFGHLHGDLAVKTIAAAVMEVVPKTWKCIRYGGDEFLVVGNNKMYKGEDYCSLIKQRVSQKTSVMRLPYNLSASVGTYTIPFDSTLTLEEAVEKVDEIMYAQKQAFHQAEKLKEQQPKDNH